MTQNDTPPGSQRTAERPPRSAGETVRSVSRRSREKFILILIVAALPGFLEGFDVNVYTYGSPYIVRDVHASAAALGTLATGYAIGLALFSMLGGYLFDRTSVKYVVMASIAVFAGATFYTGYAPNEAALFAGRLAVGAGVGVFQPAVSTLLSDIFWRTRARAIAVFAAALGLGLFLGPYIVKPFLPAYREPFAISALMAIVILVLFFFIIPRTYKKMERQKLELAGLANRNVVILSMAIFLFGLTLFGFLGYYSEYLINVLHLSNGASTGIYSMGGLGGLICAIPIGWMADRIGRNRGCTFAAFLIAVGSIGMFSVSNAVIPLFIFTFIFGTGWNIFISLCVTLSQDSTDDSIAGSAAGWIYVLFNVGAIFGGPLFSHLIRFGFVTAGLITLGLTSVMSFILTLFTRPIKESNILTD